MSEAGSDLACATLRQLGTAAEPQRHLTRSKRCNVTVIRRDAPLLERAEFRGHHRRDAAAAGPGPMSNEELVYHRLGFLRHIPGLPGEVHLHPRQLHAAAALSRGIADGARVVAIEKEAYYWADYGMQTPLAEWRRSTERFLRRSQLGKIKELFVYLRPQASPGGETISWPALPASAERSSAWPP